MVDWINVTFATTAKIKNNDTQHIICILKFNGGIWTKKKSNRKARMNMKSLRREEKNILAVKYDCYMKI